VLPRLRSCEPSLWLLNHTGHRCDIAYPAFLNAFPGKAFPCTIIPREVPCTIIVTSAYGLTRLTCRVGLYYCRGIRYCREIIELWAHIEQGRRKETISLSDWCNWGKGVRNTHRPAATRRESNRAANVTVVHVHQWPRKEMRAQVASYKSISHAKQHGK
jgi:hypothetical protein